MKTQTGAVENESEIYVKEVKWGHLKYSTLPTGEVGQKYYALKKSSPFVNSY